MKKRLLAGLLCLTLLPVTGCSKAKPQAPVEEPSEVTQETKEEETPEEVTAAIPQVLLSEQTLHASYADHEDTAVTGHFVTASLDDASAAEYPELAKALEKLSEKTLSNGVDSFLELRADALSYEKENEDIAYMQGSTEQVVNVFRNDGVLLTLLQETYDYYPGAAHGMYDTRGVTFDVASGARLALSDVWKGTQAELVESLAAKLNENYPEADFFSEDIREDIVSILEMEEYAGWYVGKRGLHFYFGPYSLASYASGGFEVELPYEAYAKQLNEAYFAPAEGWQMASFISSRLYAMCSDFDIDGDGTYETIQTLPRFDDASEDTSMADGATVVFGDETLEVDLNAEEIQPYYISDGDGHLYIYLVTGGLATEPVIAVCESNGKSLHYVDTFPGTLAEVQVKAMPSAFSKIPEAVGITTRQWYAFSNPQSFYLEQVINPLSTAEGRMEYEIGFGGMPKAVSEAYEIVSPFALTTMVELEAENAEDGSAVMLPAGSEITILASDAATYVEGVTEDGTRVRIACDLSWPQTVAEQKAEDVFEGIYYDE